MTMVGGMTTLLSGGLSSNVGMAWGQPGGRDKPRPLRELRRCMLGPSVDGSTMAGKRSEMEYSGKGDPVRNIALLWRKRSNATPIGRSGLTVDSIVETAIALADEQGLAELSMRAIARRLGVGAMSLYTHVPSKSELIDLMVDTVWSEVATPVSTGNGWRADLERIARDRFELCLRHPWLVYLVETRPVIGPNILAAWEVILRPLDGIGLTESEMERITTLIDGFVTMSARRLIDLGNIERVTGQSLESWWYGVERLLTVTMETGAAPVAERVGEATGGNDLFPEGLQDAYRFQLGLILDGIEQLVGSRKT
jgi:AcrR family transcriptional regulator